MLRCFIYMDIYIYTYIIYIELPKQYICKGVRIPSATLSLRFFSCSSNRPCPVNSPSPPYFKSFCLSFQEVQRAGHMHCKFLGLTETTADKNGSTFMCTYTPQSSPTSGSASRNEAAANAGESTSVEPQTNAQQGKGTVTASRNGERNKQCGLGILEGVRTIAVKDAQSGWLVGKRTCDREHFLALDDPKTTFKKALEDANRFSSLHFSNIFV